VSTPAQLATVWTLPELRAALKTATGWKRVLLLNTIRIKLDRLWRPYD
jgi:hypothetical protein